MCGILLVAERDAPINPPRCDAALKALAHRGPDGAGIIHIPLETGRGRRHVALGHRRLSILDLSDAASQPFRRKGAALTYNGEIYNFRTLRSGLAANFTTDGDTEVLFEALRLRGVESLGPMVGMWGFCYLDEANSRVIAARDRLGKKPLFYFADARTICFASEIGAIHAYLGERPRIDRSVVDTYLAYGWTLPGGGNASPIVEIKQVRPGGYLTVDLEAWRIESGTYAEDQMWAPTGTRPKADVAETLRQAVLDRLVSDREVGLLLSGGIDSSLILSILAREGLHERVHCFVGDAGKSEDADYAARVVAAFGVKAEIIPLRYEGSMDRFLGICRHQQKPFPLIGNVLGLPELYEAIAARNVPVVLDGTGADEIFGGYWERYYRFALAEAWEAGDQHWISTAIETNRDHQRLNAIGENTLAALTAGTWPPESTQGALPGAEVKHLLARFGAAEVASAAPADPLARRKCSFSQALYTDVTAALLPEWLWQNDSNAMRSGVENRSPFLDVRLAGHLGTGYRSKFSGRWNKHELRQLFDKFRPAPTQWRREKQGFRWAFARFLRANRSEVLELIAASTLVGAVLDRRALLDAIGQTEELLFSDLTQRCLCLAGLEAATGLRMR